MGISLNSMEFYKKKYTKIGLKLIKINGKYAYRYITGKYSFDEITAMIADGYIPVATADELDGLRNSSLRVMGSGTLWAGLYNTGLDKKYVRVANIDLSGFANWNSIGDANNDIFFEGEFDGNDLIINNFYSTIGGLFDVVKNVKIKNISLNGNMAVLTNDKGLLVNGITLQSVVESEISNVFVSGTVSGNGNIGGIVGRCNFNTEIDSCTFSGTVSGNDNIGGIGGFCKGEVINSKATGSISGRDGVGGIAGRTDGGNIEKNDAININVTGSRFWTGGVVGFLRTGTTIRRCNSSGKVKNTATAGNGHAGGLLGLSSSAGDNSIYDSYSDCEVEVTAANSIGGLIGYHNTGNTVNNSYSTGIVIGAGGIYVGGLIGRLDGTITNSYYDTDTSGQSDTGKGLPRTTAQLENGTADSFINPDGTTDDTETPANAMFTGWDDTIWDFTDTTKYPELL